MAVARWDSVRMGPLGERMARFLERYPKADEIYITSAMDGDHGRVSHHYGRFYEGSPTAAIDIGAGGYPAGSEKMRDVARWLYDNFSDYAVELIHTTPFHDDDGFYVKNQVRDPGGDIYGEEVRNAHLNHVHWATSANLISALEGGAVRSLRDLAAIPDAVPVWGWDASDHDWRRGPMDLVAAQRDGVSFFIHKTTEGSDWPAQHFQEALERARDAGIPVLGSFHFLWPGDIESQVNFWMDNVDQQTPWWRDVPWIWQVDSEGSEATPAPHPDEVALAVALVRDRMAREGTAGYVIAYTPYWKYHDDLPGGFDIWNSNYNGSGAPRPFREQYEGVTDSQGGWNVMSGRKPRILQFAEDGVVGTQSTCCVDKFDGTLHDLVRLCGRDPELSGAPIRGAEVFRERIALDRDRVLVPAERSLDVPTKGIDMALSAAEQRELLRLLREFAPLPRRLEGQLDGGGTRGFDSGATALGTAPVGDYYWNRGIPGRVGAARSRIESQQVDAQQILDLRGGRVSGPPTPSARELPRIREIDGTREALRAIEAIDPGPPIDFPRKIGDVTGPGHSDRFGMAATDLGVLARTPSGRILAVFGDTFRDAFVGSADWRAPVALFSDTKNLDGGIVWSEAAGPNPHYAQQLWHYDHFPPGGLVTVLPSDIMTIGNTMYLHVSVHFPFGNVGFTEIWKSVNDGRSWTTPHRFDAHIHRGLAQLWTWDVGDDGFVYVMSTGFRVNRDQPIILRRVRADRLEDPGAYEGWGFGPNGWAWGNEPTPVLDGGYGELCLRRIDGQWVLVAFNAGDYRLDVRVFFDITSNLYDVTTFSPIHGTAWGQEADDAVAQLYGPSILPGSRVGGGFHIFLSQWQNPGVWPYHVMQFKIPMPGARDLRELPEGPRPRKAPPKKAQPRKAPPAKKAPAKKRARKVSARKTATKRTPRKATGDY